MSEKFEHISTDIVLEWRNEQVRALEADETELATIRDRIGDEAFLADLRLNYALGRIAGQREMLNGLAAFMITQSAEASGEFDPSFFDEDTID